jgi:NAD(P)H dehydrogenase (quinone)
MNVLIVYAHPSGPQAFGAAMLRRSVEELETLGHQVRVSDLYEMGFNPIASEADFKERRFPNFLQYDREQKYSTEHHTYSDDIAAEIEKLVWCDFLIVQFPIWWFSMPAMLKGWVDRVFVNGLIYGKGKRYDTGGLKGRRAMVVATTSAYADMCGPDGMMGDLNVILWPIQNGTLAYAGFQVLPPYMAWSIHYVDDEQRRKYLDEYGARLRVIDQTAPLFFHPKADFGPDWRLKQGIEPRAAGQTKLRP